MKDNRYKIQIWVSASLKKMIDEISELSHVTKSEMIRNAVKLYAWIARRSVEGYKIRVIAIDPEGEEEQFALLDFLHLS